VIFLFFSLQKNQGRWVGIFSSRNRKKRRHHLLNSLRQLPAKHLHPVKMSRRPCPEARQLQLRHRQALRPRLTLNHLARLRSTRLQPHLHPPAPMQRRPKVLVTSQSEQVQRRRRRITQGPHPQLLLLRPRNRQVPPQHLLLQPQAPPLTTRRQTHLQRSALEINISSMQLLSFRVWLRLRKEVPIPVIPPIHLRRQIFFQLVP